MDNAILEWDKNSNTKTLGLQWNHKKDVFQYIIKIKCSNLCEKNKCCQA